jgi:hypothetical protein
VNITLLSSSLPPFLSMDKPVFNPLHFIFYPNSFLSPPVISGFCPKPINSSNFLYGI